MTMPHKIGTVGEESTNFYYPGRNLKFSHHQSDTQPLLTKL